MIKNKPLTCLMALFVSFNTIAFEGSFEINQACVDTGCFPGDTPGFPVIITQEGYYKLTSDLTLSEDTQSAISVESDNVTVDLQGHTIRGTNLCTGAYQDCTYLGNVGAGIGIGLNTIVNTTVKNGSVIGTGYIGVGLGDNCRVVNMNVQHVVRAGIRGGLGCLISNSTTSYISDLGVQTGSSTIASSSVSYVGQIGIATSQSIVKDVVVFESGEGITDGFGSTIINANVHSNSIGIRSENGGTSIVDSNVSSNIGLGVWHQNAIAFDPLGVPITIKGNHLKLNNGGSDNSQIGGPGSIVEIGTNFCGRDTVCN